MKTTPMVSVIIPAYRCADTICDTIDSVLIQDVPMEILVIDDCPEEPVEAALEKYSQDLRLIYLKNEKNMGAAMTRNRAVTLAKAPYVAFLDSDDQWMPGKLKKQLQVLQDTDAVLCCTARELMTPQGQPTGKVIGVKELITYRELFKFNCINCSSVVIKTEVAREFPMTHEASHEDYIMWLKVLRKYGEARGLDEPLIRYRLSNTGKSGSKLKSAWMTFTAYRHAGLSLGRSLLNFCSYAFYGTTKYLFPKKRTNYDT